MAKGNAYGNGNFSFRMYVFVKFSYVCGNKPVKTEQNVNSNN